VTEYSYQGTLEEVQALWVSRGAKYKGIGHADFQSGLPNLIGRRARSDYPSTIDRHPQTLEALKLFGQLLVDNRRSLLL